MNRFLPLLLALGLSATAQAADAPVYGGSMPEGEATPIGAAIDALADHAGTPGKFTGRITQVCQRMGCWLILEDDGRHARVMARDHGYGIPVDSSGQAIVYGELSEHSLSEEQAAHLAEDAGDAAAPRQEYRIVADAIVVVE